MMAPYCGSKHALLGMGRSYSVALREQGVRVTTFCPGWINTDIEGEGTAGTGGMDPDRLAKLLVDIALQDPSIEIQELLVRPMP